MLLNQQESNGKERNPYTEYSGRVNPIDFVRGNVPHEGPEYYSPNPEPVDENGKRRLGYTPNQHTPGPEVPYYNHGRPYIAPPPALPGKPRR